MTLQLPGTDHTSALPSHDARAWVCVSCRAANPMEADVCTACGTSFSALLQAGTPSSPSPSRHVVPALREAGLLLGLFVLWRLAGTVSVLQQQGAFDRARALWQLERTLRLPSEVALQASILRDSWLVSTLDVFYLAAHVGGMIAFLTWMFVRHRAQYRRWRNVVVTFTGISLLAQLVSVAPPRLLPQLGFVDTAALHHQSAYQDVGPGLVDQLSSMPSIHVGWAVIVACGVVSVSRSRWRTLAVVHPLLTGYVVVVTGNHFWLDGVAAAALVGVIVAVDRRLEDRLRGTRQHERRAGLRNRSTPAPGKSHPPSLPDRA